MFRKIIHSADYRRRQKLIFKSRALVFAFIGFLFFSLIFLSLAEGAVVNLMLQEQMTFFQYFLFGILICSFLMVYSFLLSRLIVHILYNLEHAAIAQTIVTSATVFIYAALFYRFKNFQPNIYLATSKLLVVLLLFRFWKLRFFEIQDRVKSAIAPQQFLKSWNSFLICRWVVVACFLLMFLGIALAFVSSHPVIALNGWEGIVLMLSFYFVFRAFAQSPQAHLIG